MSTHKKQRSLEKKRKRKLDKKRMRPAELPLDGWRPAELPLDGPLIRNPPGMKKMSEVLLEFIAPCREQAPEDDMMPFLVQVGVLAWNTALLSPENRAKAFRKFEDSIPIEDHKLFYEIVEPLIRRKQEFFADNRRFILGFDISDGPHGFSVNVISTLPGS